MLLLKLQNKKLWFVPKGVRWFSFMHRILSNPFFNSDVRSVSLYCTISRPLHSVGPSGEKVPIVKNPLTDFRAISMYLLLWSAVVKKWKVARSCHTSYVCRGSNSVMSLTIQLTFLLSPPTVVLLFVGTRMRYQGRIYFWSLAPVKNLPVYYLPHQYR